MIGSQLETHNISQNVRSPWDALYDTTQLQEPVMCPKLWIVLLTGA
jgi:hypothetical protein